MTDDRKRYPRAALEDFCAAAFARLGLEASEARTSAEVLVAADASGIPSHGLARLGRYVEGLRSGLMVPDARPLTLAETPTSLVVDAQGGMGAPVSKSTMHRTIAKARDSGAAFACVRDSNHFGIAGYYARLALGEGMLGIAMTNTAALGVPTFGSAVRFGTNPIAFAAPAGEEEAFVLDMSTTVVSRGKVEVKARAAKPLPRGWAVDRSGGDTEAAGPLLEDMQARAGGGLLPLGGRGTDLGGHKGYGLAVMVDILCAALSGAPFGDALRDTEGSSARVSHFFGAIRVASFRDLAAFRADMDGLLRSLRSTPPAAGEERVLYAGLPECEFEADCALRGVPVAPSTLASMEAVARALGVPWIGG